MRPAFGQRGLRAYHYYVSPPLAFGDGHDGREDAIHRVPGRAIEDLVVGQVERIAGEMSPDMVRSRLRALIGRVEVQSAAVCLVIRTGALPSRPGPRAAFKSIRDQLRPGEQVLPEPSNAGLLRIRLPVRLVVRGGRTWLRNAQGGNLTLAASPNRGLVARQRAAYATLRRHGLEPDGRDQRKLLNARAPKCRPATLQIAFLAPDIQRAILSGDQQFTPALRGLLEDRLPLAWTEQRSRLGLSPPGDETRLG